MNTNNTRRTAACGGALVLALGAGLCIPLSAQAAGSPLAGTVNTVLSGAGAGGASSGQSAPTSTTGTGGSALLDAATGAVSATGLTSGSTSTPTGTSTTALGIPVELGSAATPGSGAVTVPGVISVGTGTAAPVTTVVQDVLGGGSAGGSGGTGGTGAGGVAVTVGQQPDGGSVTSVNLGGTGAGTGTASGSTSTTTNTTTTTTYVGGDTGTAPAPSAAPAPAPAPVRKLLGLTASPTIATVFPAKDGYRDTVVFRIAGRTSSGAVQAVTGTAVLRRGAKEVARWNVTRSTQDLRWNGLDHGKVVAGDYGLTTEVKDATGALSSATTKVAASPKRLTATTHRLSAPAISGKHIMAAAPRAGLGKGTVTLKVMTVASKVKGKQFLYIVKNGKRLTIPIKAGTHTSRAITVPKAFTDFTLQHTWKKGQVALKSIRYTYSYQSLR